MELEGKKIKKFKNIFRQQLHTISSMKDDLVSYHQKKSSTVRLFDIMKLIAINDN